MKAADIPTKFQIPWASAAVGPYINAIPQASQIGITAGRASLTDGFVPVNFTPVSAGGVPPFGGDMNGILKQISQWSQWDGASGPISYDGTFSAAIGGYPKGAIIAASTFGNFWLCTADDNTANPDSGGANWLGFCPINKYAVDSGSVNALVVTLAPVPVSLASLTGVPINIKVAATNTSVTPNVTINGFAALTIINPDGSALRKSQFIANSIITIISDGTNAQLVAGSSLVPVSTRQVLTSGSGTYTTPTTPPRQLRIRQVGAGGGGAGTGAGGLGGDTTFNGITATGGTGGAAGVTSSGGAGGAGGSAGAGSATLRIAGGRGGAGSGNANSSIGIGGAGGNGAFGGSGMPGSSGATAGTAAAVNSGAGGGGLGQAASGGSGGGGAGEYVEHIINAPAATYTYAVGAAGAAGTGNGGAGGSGLIIVEEIY